MIKDVLEIMGRWLSITDEQEVIITLAAALASQFSGEPVWMFLVGPSGSTKTEILRSLSTSDMIYTLDSVTGKSFISGFYSKDSKSHDLLPRLNGKLLVIKDFSILLETGTQKEKDKIFSVLRNAYDGYYEAEFGSPAGRKSYHATFGILAGVTEVIDYYSKVHALLGERFIKLRTRYDRHKAIQAAFKHSGNEKQMREEISEVVRMTMDFYSTLSIKPRLLPETARKIEYLSDCTAILRSPIPRDYKREVSYLLRSEVATRLGKQLLRLAECLFRMDCWNYSHLLRVAEDCIAPERMQVAKYLKVMRESTLTTIAQGVKQPRHLVKVVAEDLWLLGVCERRLENDTYYYKLTDEFKLSMEEAKL